MMKKMKRIVAVLLAGVMALTMLTACGSGGGNFTQNATVENSVMDFFVNGEINKSENYKDLSVQEIPANSPLISYFNTLASESIVEVAKNPALYESSDAIEEWISTCLADETLAGYLSLRIVLPANSESATELIDENNVALYFENILAILIYSMEMNSADLEAHIQVYQIGKGENAYWVLYALGRQVPTSEP